MTQNDPNSNPHYAPKVPLSVKNLSVTYAGQSTPALDNVSLDILSGKMVAIIGPNGAGKSTFLKAVLGLIPNSYGEIEFFGQPIEKTRRKIAYVPQRASIDWDFPISVQEIVHQGLFADLKRFEFFTPARHKDIVQKALVKVGLETMTRRQISMLSGGQQQRMFIARAFAQSMMQNGAELFLLDEPFTGIDAQTEKELATLLKTLTEDGKTVIAVHHNLATVPDYFNSVILVNRTLINYGSVQDAFTEETIRKTYLPLIEHAA